MPDTKLLPVSDDDDPTIREELHVHQIYNAIAPHFSQTRYKPWPVVENFLSSIPLGSIGLDSGTGNGKYLHLPRDRSSDILTVGLDRSINLLKIAQHANERHREVVLADVQHNCWRAGVFDYAISIATIHHLASSERRGVAIECLLRCVHPSRGRVLIYVWAMEQDSESKRVIPAAGSGQGVDALVPWVLSKSAATKSPLDKSDGVGPQVFNRYYHFFAHGELRQLVHSVAQTMCLHVGPPHKNGAGLEIIQDGYEKSNFFIELRRWKT